MHTTSSHKLPRLLIILACCALLGACSIGQPSKPAAFYVLTPQASMGTNIPDNLDTNTARGSNTDAEQNVIGVGPIRIPSYIDRPQMVLRSGHDVRITLDEFNRWGEPLADNIPRIVTDMVALHAGKDAAVVQYPSASNRHANVWITMNINRLDGALNESATIDTWWSIVSRDGDLLHTGRFRHSVPVGSEYADLATAESSLLWLATKAAMEFVDLK